MAAAGEVTGDEGDVLAQELDVEHGCGWRMMSDGAILAGHLRLQVRPYGPRDVVEGLL